MSRWGAQQIGIGVVTSIIVAHYVKEALSEFAKAMISVINEVTSTAGQFGSLLGFVGTVSIVLICAKNRIFIRD